MGYFFFGEVFCRLILEIQIRKKTFYHEQYPRLKKFPKISIKLILFQKKFYLYAFLRFPKKLINDCHGTFFYLSKCSKYSKIEERKKYSIRNISYFHHIHITFR